MFKNILLVSAIGMSVVSANKYPKMELFPDTITPPPAPTPFSIDFDDRLSDSEQGSVVYKTPAKMSRSPKAFRRLEEAMSYNFVYQFAIDFENERRIAKAIADRSRPGYLNLDDLYSKLKTLSAKPRHEEQGAFEIFSRVSESD